MLFAATVSAHAENVLIEHVLLVDGTGATPYHADLRVEGDRVVAIGTLVRQPDEAVIDGEGLALAPGFIDTHSYHDELLDKKPDALAAVSQGITTIVVGQDGGSILPLSRFFAERTRRPAAVNVAAYSGHNTLRDAVLGEGFKRRATTAETERMRVLLAADMKAGALGLSTGLEYDPGIYASTDEVVTLAREAAAYGGTGYYRFELPDADWRTLIATLGTLPAAEALAVNDSVWASFAAGRAAPDLLVEAARRIADNPDGTAAIDGAARLRTWRVRGLVAGDDLPAYRRLVAALYGPKLSALRLDVRAGVDAAEDPKRRAFREDLAAIMAEEARDPELRATLAAAARRYLDGEKTALDEGFLSLALTVHLQEHDLTTARALLTRAETSDDPVFKVAAITAVGAGAQVETAADVVALVFEPKLAVRTRSGLAGALLGRPDTRAVARAAVVPRLADLSNYIPGLSSFGDTGSFDQACSAAEATAIETALRPHVTNIRGGGLEVDRIIERVASCGMLATQRSWEIVKALK